MIDSIILVLAVTFGTARAQTGCETQADVTFLIDSTNNVGSQNFQKQLAFIRDVTNNMQIGADKVQVSALTFGTSITNQFDLNQYTDKAALQNAIMGISYGGGDPKIANAIHYATGTSFSPLHGGRADAPHVTVLLTSQPSGSIDVIKLESQTARDNGLILYTVGIGNNVDTNELKIIASDPDSRHVYTSQNFDSLSSLSDLLAIKICNELPPDPAMLPTPTSCLTKADLVFMVDSSSSVGSTNFQKLEHFLKDIVTKINVGPDNVHVGVVKYGNYPSVEFPLTQYTTRPEVMKAIEGMTYSGGGTNDADAISYTAQQVMNQNSGARGDVPRIAVLITDGGSANPGAAVSAADKARMQNIGFLTVGVGNNVNNAELNNIADKPSSSNAFTVNSYGNLDSITDRLIAQMCTVKATQPSITTAAPGGTLPPDPCHDKLNNCDQYGPNVCVDYGQWAHDNCAKTCGTCAPLYTSASPKCVDLIANCANLGRDACSQMGSYVSQNCPLFCGLCGTNTSSTGYYSKCSYKGKSYSTGEKWYDGCDYECICEDANSGKYKCSNRCPVYHNLPQTCTLVAQPGACCLQPVCNFNPIINIQESSGHAVTTDGIDVCVYKGKQYFNGQTWRDGCDYQCTCTDSKTGLYKCEELCPAYNSIPPYCHLERMAGECCRKPVCEFDSQTGSFQGSGSISGYGVGAIPTEHPPCLDAIPSCNMYGRDVCVSYRGWATANCRKFCDMCPDGLPQPGPDDRCVYNGQLYQQGDTWSPSCDTMCTCENAIYGYYRCTNTCPTYNNLPNVCHMVKNAGDCCPTAQCPTGYFLSSSTNPGTIGNGGAITVINPPPGIQHVQPTLPSGGTPQPGSGGSGFSAPTIDGCLYKGQLYVQDQAWEDGCQLACVCSEASTGLYTCREKCPSYPALPPSCHMVTDTNDECCQVPKCGPDPVTHQIPIPIPVFQPAVHSHGSVMPPSTTDLHSGMYSMTVYLVQTGLTPAPPTAPAGPGVSGGVGYCMYRGTKYLQAQVWEDGCDFNCICDDASRGHYQCSEKCVHYGALPSQCYLVTDPVNPCCNIPKCNFPVNYVTHIGELKTTTAKPAGDFCVYEGQMYQQGQTWYDGCSYRCTCENAGEGVYRCLSRCPQYENVGEGCTFVPDPKDPSCCQMPQCPTTSTTSPGHNITPAPPGTYVGHGLGTGYCEYKGIHYSQGQTWQDGCDYNCQCTDAESGFYRCSDVCQRYNNVPSYCTLITDFKNPCCQVPRCNFPAVTQAVTGQAVPSSTLPPTPLPPGQTPVPGSTNAPQYNSCVYKGVQYNQGETWDDGCQYRCRCDNADKGLYVCNQRCATYDSVPATCTMVTDPRDSCCLVPSCPPQPQSNSSPIPGVSTPNPTPYPTAAPGAVTGSANVPTPLPGMTQPPLKYCEYKGQQYSQGQRWDDGCEFTCECIDEHVGKYKCLEKCTRYVNLPNNCRLSRDPANPCCQVPECIGEPTPAPPSTAAPPHGYTPTATPQMMNVCMYKGNMYTQGQQWYDGCDYICNCEDSHKGLYTCNDRCPQYGSMPTECTLIQSSSDPLCCKEPKCVFQNTKNQTAGYLTPPTPPPGIIEGGVATPKPSPTMAPSLGPTFGPQSTTPAPPKVCVYKGNSYQQGQQWQDGCNYNCECLDAETGHYRCTEICAKYDNLPLGCRFITDAYNPCCKIPYCPAVNVPTPAPPGVSTPAPTPAPKSGCMYNGVMFNQGQQWNDGCDLQCVCEDQMSGFYRCRDRCNKYDVPEGCSLVTDPRDACCKVPLCLPPTTPVPWVPGMVPTPQPGYTFAPDKIPTPGPDQTYAPGMYPTWVPGMPPTPAHGMTYAPDKVPTPGPGQTYAPGMYPTWVPGMEPTPAPGMTFAPDKIPTPAPGSTYPPGMFPTWVPGMIPTPAPGKTFAPDKIPTPAPGSTYPPGLFPTWVPGMEPTPAPGMTFAPDKIPTPAVGETYPPGMFPTWVPGMVPTPAPGMTFAPDKIPTPAPGSTYAPGMYPTWVPGMVPTPAPGVTFAPDKIPTPAPGSTYAPMKFPSWVPGMIPTPAPGYTYPPYLIPTPAPGMTYAPGQFPVITPSPYPTPAPGSTFPPWNPGMVPTPQPGMTYAPELIPTPAPGSTYAPGHFPSWIPGMIPTPMPGKTFAPWLVPGFTPAVGSTYAPFHYPAWVPGMVPTPAPGVTFAPDKIPTPAHGSTYAPGMFPTWVPGMVPTPAPGMTFAPGKLPTPSPGHTYAPGMYPTWVPGMVPTPAPGVTFAPNKIPTPAPGQTYAPGQYPTWVPGMVPTPAPGMTYAPNKLPTPGPGRTYAPGMYPTWIPGMVPTPAPGVTYAPDKIPTPGPGQTYAPGMYPTWVPGMVPTPAPGVTYAPNKIPTPAPGHTYAPGQYPTWVPGMPPTPQPGQTFAPNKIPTPGPGQTYAPGMYPTWVPGMEPTPAPGMTFAPDKIPTPAPGSTYPPGMFPTWVPGMIPTPAPGKTFAPDKIPTPAPGSTYPPGLFPTWVPGMEPTPAPGMTFAPDKIPTPAVGETYPPGMFPTWVPGMVPTPAPGMTFAPDKIPTPAPGSTYAPGMYPTWVPGMVPTPAPGVTFAPDKIPTPAPGSTYAPMKFPSWVPGMIPTPAPGYTYPPYLIPTPAPGMTYAPGQFPVITPSPYPTPAPGSTFPPWNPGMVPTPQPGMTYAPELIPTPAPGSTYAPGHFPSWIPGMIPTPMPGKTFAPWLVPGFTPAVGSTYAPFHYPAWVPGMVPTPAPGVTFAPDKIPTPAHGSTYAPGMFPTWVPGMVPTPAPGMTFAPGKLPTPSPGHTYAPGMYPTWVPGMVPTPAPGVTFAPNKIPTPAPGQTYAPGQYPTWVPGMVPTPAPGMTYAPNKLPTPGPGRTYAPGMYPTWIPGMVPTPAPGVTYAPDKIPTPGPGQTYAPGMYPTWVPGMVPTPAPGVTYAPNKIPTPAPGHTYAPGQYPTWVPGMPPTPQPGSTYAPDKIPTPGIGLTYAPGMFPTPAPTPNPYPVPTAIPGVFQGSGVNSNVSGCVHYGVVYNAGQTWRDGCKYDCECLDDHTGRYQCKERCPMFLNIPSYCRMVVDPNDACCKIPVCNTAAPPTPQPKVTQGPTPAPGTGPTPSPGTGPAPTPAVGQTPQPQPSIIPTPQPKEGCVMNNQIYIAGQTWYMGCDMQCVCEDGKTGFYRCFDRCAKYPTIPTGCKLVPDPKDPTCCEVPQCIPIPGPGQTVPSGPPMVVTGVPGIVSGSGTPPTPLPGTDYTAGPKDVCVYGGRMYTQGQKWQDGCQYNCVCTDGMTGKYECTQRCATFPLVPPQCKMQRDPNDVCCFVPVCDYDQTSPTLPPLVSPGVSTMLPQLPPSFCVYKGVPFSQGQTWDDGCQKKCRCDDADNNIYTCFDRCTSYNNLISGCVMVSDPNDACCTIPQCTYVPTLGPPVSGTTLTPPTVCPYPMPTAMPGVISGGPQADPVTGVQPSNVGYCEYKGQRYTRGQTWDDGCSFTCECIDTSSGQYQCQEKCPRYVGIPSYCKMAQDPNNKCCTKPACNVCPHTPAPDASAPTPVLGQSTTPVPKKDVCIMSGKEYSQGQKWYVGCDKICVCDDGKSGAYSCNDRCPNYPLQPGCVMAPDPRDPVCCQAPKCIGNPGVYGTFNGSAPPTLAPPMLGSTLVAPSQPPQVCIYKGKSYTQGQKWQDGCQYECLCDNGMTGQYHCTDRCPTYPNLPSTCHLAYDPANPCCQKIECQAMTPTPVPGMSTPIPSPTPSTDVCVYQGVPFRQGQTFSQGCDKLCKCEDAAAGKITCNDKCPTYPALTPNCTLVTDPNDQCCQIPACKTPTGVVGVPGTISGSNLPGNNPYMPAGTRNGCVYNSQIYQQGQTWDDGCTYTCECLDATTGQYRCSEKCPRLPPLPSYCQLTADPTNKCCQKPYCQPPTQVVTPTPGHPGLPTLAPPTHQNVCVYKGNSYQQGQQWFDGCDYTCRCDNASTNYYTCQQRCAAFTSVPNGCTMVADPKDPTCCETPNCPILPPTGLSPTPGIFTVAPQPGGVITGGNPTPAPGFTLPPPYRSGCVYKGMLFYQGQKFDDGCDYECECLDNATGQYKCAEKCQKYTALPSECILIQDQNKPCCQVPYCDFSNPTPFALGVPTPQPPVMPSPRPGVITVAPYIVPGLPSTPRPGVNPSPTPSSSAPTPQPQGYCVYKGVYYTQGQTWYDGCTQKCQCDDVMKGYYTCSQRCPSYPVTACPMKTDPSDSCCLIPDCNTGHIPTPMPTPHPGQSTMFPVMTPKPISGSFIGNSGGNPVVVPYQPGSQYIASTPACVYKGMIYTQGQQWHDGCDYNCECIDANRGQYRCTDRCPKYPYLPPQCYFKQSTTDSCCQEPECNIYNMPITVIPQSSQGPSGTHPPTFKPADKCVYYNGIQYAQGATWQDGCSTICECSNAAANTFQCNLRCPVFSGLPAYCSLIQNPADTCCMMPICTAPSGGNLSPLYGNGTNGIAPPTSLEVVPIGTHVVITGYGKPQPGRDRCVYKGSLYSQGDSWDDGCNFVCTCENTTIGMYRCTSKCPQMPTLPNYCKSVNVPGQCCPTITCDIPSVGIYNPVPQLVPTPRPSNPPPGASTSNPFVIIPQPQQPHGGGTLPGSGYYFPNSTNPDTTGQLRDKCVYKNRLYNQGEQWDDGCEYNCECLDGRTGYYVCNPLCPVYNNLPSSQCYLVKADGQCCSQPMCYDPNKNQVLNPLTSTSVFPVVGTYQGGITGFRPYTSPGQNSGHTRNACVYKGSIYQKGQKWDDGCDFQCTCIDEITGQYSCSPTCPSYTNIPPICRLEPQTGSCCKSVICTSAGIITYPPGSTQTPATTPPPDKTCYDKISNCLSYGQSACRSPYEQWARRNCNNTCGFCTPIHTTAPPVCEDKLSDCQAYGLTGCSGIYEPWAQDNCRKFCGLCTSSAPSVYPVSLQTAPPAATCVDIMDSCDILDTSYYCSGDNYDFAINNCKKTCNLCNDVVTTSTLAPVTVPNYRWILFLKGVAGAQGPDLYQLWHSTQILNANEPLAPHLTTEFNGHYKPDYSNDWDSYCIDQVRVSIYNQGVEKAYIIFNATGANKETWFTSDRIISSTWTDIKSASKEIFSMTGDAHTGREFYVTGHSDPSDSCDVFAWMMIATKSTCFVESADKKPAFLYAPGTSIVHFGNVNPSSGDVFAIQAHPTCMPVTQHVDVTHVTQPSFCSYNGQQYTQGQYWLDGCNYNCTCLDASIGYYRCRNLCPQYSGLPAGCKLVTDPGQCCAKPDCQSESDVITIAPIVIYGGAMTCQYKGSSYVQGQTWNDGCDQSCTCTDASKGLYSCRAVCLNWNTLPSLCHVEDAPPGLCCQQPKCPSGFIINVPTAYKNEYPGYIYT